MQNTRPVLWLRPREPFSFARTLRFVLSPPPLLNRRTFSPLLDYFEDDEYRRVAEIGGQPVLYGVNELRQGSPALRVRVLTGPTDRMTHAALRALVERQFSTTLDLSRFSRLVQADTRRPVLA